MKEVTEPLFRVEQVILATGVTERSLHYWDRTQVISPSVKGRGPGVYRGYTRNDIILISLITRMRRAGVSLQRIRGAMRHLRAIITTAHDRGNVAEIYMDKDHPLIIVHSADQVEAIVDALRGGQLVLALPIESVQSEVERKLPAPGWRRRGSGRSGVRSQRSAIPAGVG